MSDWTPDQKHKADHTIENGRWIVCNQSIQFGTPVGDPVGTTTFEVNHSAMFFTQVCPFDWYIFGFAANWGGPGHTDDLPDTNMMISITGERENLSTRFINAAQLLGAPQEYPGGYMSLQFGHYEIDVVHEAWAWATVDTPKSQIGASIWFDRDKSLKFMAPYVLRQGDQFRFQLQNRCDSDFPDTILTIIGQRWLPWGDGGYWNKL